VKNAQLGEKIRLTTKRLHQQHVNKLNIITDIEFTDVKHAYSQPSKRAPLVASGGSSAFSIFFFVLLVFRFAGII